MKLSRADMIALRSALQSLRASPGSIAGRVTHKVEVVLADYTAENFEVVISSEKTREKDL